MKHTELPKVALRGGFSDRMGLHAENTEIQINDLDYRTRVSIVNLLSSLYQKIFFNDDFHEESTKLMIDILSNIYLQQINYKPGIIYDDDQVFRNYINNTIYNDDYGAVFTVLEYIVRKLDIIARDHYIYDISLFDLFNNLFEKEYVGYRFVNRIIVPITSSTEIEEINSALALPYDNVRKHLEKALVLMSDREAPDYENSIKESISGVEAMCSIILGTSGTLGATLKKIEKVKAISIHPALSAAFEKLYGYTTDADSGIRHAAKIGGADSTFQEARYMLVSCTAFINYLKANLSEPDR